VLKVTKNIRRGGVIFIVIIIFLAIMLNPKKNTFNHWFMENLRWRASDRAMISEVETSVKSDIYDDTSIIRRDNYFIISIFIIPSETARPYKFLGIIGWIIRIS
jgi:hypothetical protein